MASRGALRSLRAVVAALFLAPVLVLLAPGAAMACSCAAADFEQLVGYADTVAVGELTSIEPPPDRSDGVTDSGAPITYTATVHTVFKGQPDNPLVFRSAAHGASCGLEGMSVGREYAFFVRGSESGLCDGTSLASPELVAEVEAVTGPGQDAAPPRPDQGVESASDQDPVAVPESGLPTALPWIALVAGLATVVLGWLLWSSRVRDR